MSIRKIRRRAASRLAYHRLIASAVLARSPAQHYFNTMHPLLENLIARAKPNKDNQP